jgi:hypothetical protein
MGKDAQPIGLLSRGERQKARRQAQKRRAYKKLARDQDKKLGEIYERMGRLERRGPKR